MAHPKIIPVTFFARIPAPPSQKEQLLHHIPSNLSLCHPSFFLYIKFRFADQNSAKNDHMNDTTYRVKLPDSQ